MEADVQEVTVTAFVPRNTPVILVRADEYRQLKAEVKELRERLGQQDVHPDSP